MQKQMERNPAPAPCVIGIDEVSLLGDALDTLRKQEYARLSGEDRSYIKGQKYTLLSNRENLTMDGRNCSGLTSGLIRAIC